MEILFLALNFCALLDGKLVYKNAMGYANNEHKVPISTSSIFAVASISKLFSGAGISSLRHYWRKGSAKDITVILLTNGARDWSKTPDDINRGIAEIFMPTLFE